MDRKTDIARGKCDECGRIRILSASEFGRLRLAESKEGRFDPFRAAARSIGGIYFRGNHE